MPGRPKKVVPAYCHHKASGRAVVRISGRDFYLGKYGSAESHKEYGRVVAEHLAACDGQGRSDHSTGPARLTVIELVAEYWQFATRYYVKNGKPTNTQHGIRAALRPVIHLSGESLASDFGPLALKNVQRIMAEQGSTRRYINDNTSRIKAMFKWAVSEERVRSIVRSSRYRA